MKNGNIIDLSHYQDDKAITSSHNDSSISEELKHAIQNLIYRLRELGPMPQSN